MKLLLAPNDHIDVVLANLRFPYLMSPKLDGIRGHNEDGVVMSRNQKPLANSRIQETWGWSHYFGYDGEFIDGSPTDPKAMSKAQSLCNSDSAPVVDAKWFVFDYTECGLAVPYYKRLEHLKGDNLVEVIPQTEVKCMDDLLTLEDHYLELGYEGAMLRDPEGRYKEGRGTVRENIILKLKRFVDDEAIVIGFEERMHNANEKTLVKNGKAVRNHCAGGLVGLDTLGALRVRWKGVEFNIGTGFDAAEAQHIWNNRERYLGETVTFKYFPKGMIDAPRHPVFKSFRPGKN